MAHQTAAEGHRYPQQPDLDDPRGPDFFVFIYGGGFLDKDDKSKLRPGFSIPADAPPVFFLVAHDDKSNPIEAAMLYLEYKKRDLSAELHICAKGEQALPRRNDRRDKLRDGSATFRTASESRP